MFLADKSSGLFRVVMPNSHWEMQRINDLQLLNLSLDHRQTGPTGVGLELPESGCITLEQLVKANLAGIRIGPRQPRKTTSSRSRRERKQSGDRGGHELEARLSACATIHSKYLVLHRETTIGRGSSRAGNPSGDRFRPSRQVQTQCHFR